MTVHVGTSGYNYEAWRGSFYPEDLSAKKMLAYYAEQFDTVEINYSFYRKPTPKILEGWARQVPERFRFALKAWQRITHQKRLRDCAELVEPFADAARTLGARLAPILYQLPPNLKADLPLLRDFLHPLPRDLRAAFEFRHDSWLAEPVYQILAERNVSLCLAESDRLTVPEVITADFVYFRLRKPEYAPDEVATTRERALELVAAGKDVFVFFKHEDTPEGALYAEQVLAPERALPPPG